LILAAALWPGLVLAQADATAETATDDRGYLTALLEDTLSTDGVQVTITGFAGALSSQASLTQMTIADKDGVWLTLRDVALDWNRGALFSGAVEITSLTAAEIVLDRVPAADKTPSAEAPSFALPDLPVSVSIGKISADSIVLGEAVVGEAVTARLEASMQLSGGEGSASILLERTDDKAAEISLDASYVNATKVLSIDLSAVEDASGIAVRLLNVPGAPSAALTVKGTGPIDDFAAAVSLSTDDVVRLAGSVQLSGDAIGTSRFNMGLSGNPAPVFLPEYTEFFGPAVSLAAAGSRDAAGRLTLDVFRVQAQALDIYGAAALASDGLPVRFDITGKLGLEDGSPLLLPLTSDVQTRITEAALTLRYDAERGEEWSGRVDLNGLDRANFKAEQMTLIGTGRIAREDGVPAVDAVVTFDAKGLAPTDPALAQALGAEITGEATVSWQGGTGQTRLSRLSLQGKDYDLMLSGSLQGLADGFATNGTGTVRFDDLSRFSALTGRSLAGAGTISVTGEVSPLSGQFDAKAEVVGTELRSGIAQLDGLLRGQTRIDASVRRDETGTTLRNVRLAGNGLTVTAQGRLATGANDVSAEISFADLSVLGGGYRGALQGSVRLLDNRVTLDALGQGLAIGQTEADRLLRGDSKVTAAVRLANDGLVIERAEIVNPQINVSAEGDVANGGSTITLQARLANLGILLPEFPGALVVSGTAVDDGDGIVLDLTGTGPGQIDAAVRGRIDAGIADLTITGTAQAALANAFIEPRSVSGGLQLNLALRGPLALGSLSGTVALEGGRVADPRLNLALQDLSAQAVLTNGVARIDARAAVSSGGSLSLRGSVGLTKPNTSALTIDLSQVVLRDPDLYETTVNGGVTVEGPLTGGALIAGRLVLTETELRIPSTGFGGSGDLPGLLHKGEPSDVRATRARAGLLDDKKGGTGAGAGSGRFRLDLVIAAPNQVFIRGRGLDAELGGQLTLTGTTAAITPFGAFELIRGRLDILGKRLVLSRALLQMEGALVPYLDVSASTTADGYTTTVTVSGDAKDPQVSFTSDPDLPEEEVLARLLFGQGMQNLSAFQAVELASAVATLAGRGGNGLLARLRLGIGLDNLDVNTDDKTGAASVTAGKYLTEKIYTEVTVGQDGESRIDLNLDISRHITLKAGSGSNGSSGIGIFLEKDY
jgi:translocation and assembly module TamB